MANGTADGVPAQTPAPAAPSIPAQTGQPPQVLQQSQPVQPAQPSQPSQPAQISPAPKQTQPTPPAQQAQATHPVQPAQAVQRPSQQPRQAHPIQPPPPNRDTYNAQAMGRGLNALVKQARILMVGAGGIGCELLKNLALTGFGEIHAVDLDTIDLSNLNRQFLFRHEHIKQSKAQVAKEAAQKFNPSVRIVAYHADIKESRFNVEWFRSFKVVFNALDNFDARRHVNRMCLAADVPLIDSGTTGFNGQVQVIKKSLTACYDCTPKDPPKSYPVCTIRSTPSQPIHCIVWGKSYLLNEIFGTSEDQSAFDHSEDQENANEVAELKREAEALRAIRDSVGTEQFPQLLFDKVFKSDIERLRSMEGMWKDRKPPTSLDFATLKEQSSEALARAEGIVKDGQKVWSLEENFAVFLHSLERLSRRILEAKKSKEPSGPEPTIEFDKDDDDTLDFVAASANIRSTVFGIDCKSRFDIKQMAGNIIPAIATTNAIVAGLCVLETFKVLQGNYEAAREVFLSPFVPNRRIAPSRSRPPNPDCPVCSVFHTSVSVDLSRATLGDLIEEFIKPELGFDQKEFVVNNEVGTLYDVDETDNLTKKLSDLGIKPDCFLTIIDEDDNEPFVNVMVNIQELKSSSGKPVQGLQLDKKPEIPKRPKQAAVPEANGVDASNRATKQNASEALIVQGTKRPREGDGDTRDPKKARTGGEDVVIVDDGPNDGAIVIVDDD